jgi:hypothetical protein
MEALTLSVGSDESVALTTRAWENTPQGEADIVMALTSRRVLWTYLHGPGDMVMDIAFDDVIAYLGSEDRMILEANEPRYARLFGGESTLARFRLDPSASRVDVVRYVQEHRRTRAART